MNHIVAEFEARSIDPSAYILMLDVDARLSRCTAKNILMVSRGKLFTRSGATSWRVIARGDVMELGGELGTECIEAGLYPFDRSVPRKPRLSGRGQGAQYNETTLPESPALQGGELYLENADEILVTANSISMIPISKINCNCRAIGLVPVLFNPEAAFGFE